MQKSIMIGDVEVAMRASAATAIRYRNTFHGDIMKELMEMNPEQIDSSVIEKIQKLAFIMAKSAEGVNMTALTEDDYLEWLDQFDSLEMMTASKDIVSIYLGGKVSESELKKTETENLTAK